MNYQPILEQQIRDIELLFAQLDREREGQPKMYVDIKIQVRTAVQFITVDFIV